LPGIQAVIENFNLEILICKHFSIIETVIEKGHLVGDTIMSRV